MAITLTVADMRARFSYFADTTKFSDSLIQFDIDLALMILNDGYTAVNDTWKLKMAYYLTGHFISIDYKMEKGDFNSVGAIASKGLGPASVSYQGTDSNSELEATLNATDFGQQFLTILKMWRLQNRTALFVNG